MLLRRISFNQILINILILCLSGWFFYYFAFSDIDNYSSILGLCIYAVGMLLMPFVYTFSKILFAKLAGFKVIYLKIFNSIKMLNNNKMQKIKYSPTRGICDVRFGGHGKYIFSLIGGILTLILLLIGSLLCFFLIDNIYVKAVMMALAIDISYILIVNGIPNSNSFKNDGMRIWLTIKSKSFRELSTQMCGNALDVAVGKRYKDIEFKDLEFFPDKLYILYLIEYGYHYLDSDDLDSYFLIVEKLERTMINDPSAIIEQSKFLAISYGLYKHNIIQTRKYLNNILTIIPPQALNMALELNFLNSLYLENNVSKAQQIRDVLAKAINTEDTQNSVKSIIFHELNMMHPSEYELSLEGEIVEDKKYAYKLFKGNKLILMDLKMYKDAFVDNQRENGYIYGVFNDELTIQTSYGLVSAKNVIYGGRIYSAKDFSDKFNAVGVTLS